MFYLEYLSHEFINLKKIMFSGSKIVFKMMILKNWFCGCKYIDQILENRFIKSTYWDSLIEIIILTQIILMFLNFHLF